MKSTRIVLIAPIVTIFLFITFVILLVEAHPYKPGDFLFPLQNTAEIGRVKLSFSTEKRVEGYFDLVEHRLRDLESITQIEQVRPTIEAFDLTLTKAVESINLLDWDYAVVYYHNIHPLMRRVEVVLDDIPATVNHKDLVFFREKVENLKTTLSSSDILKVAATHYSLFHVTDPEEPVMVVKEKSSGVKPVEYTRKVETETDCMGCHANGLYMDPESRCSDCHLREVYFSARLGTDAYRPLEYMDKYPDHFFGDCRYCHFIKSWNIEQFDHPHTFTCVVCHENDNPELEPKLPDQTFLTILNQEKDSSLNPHENLLDCVMCHQNTTSWQDATFKHEEICGRCHYEGKFVPANLQDIDCAKTLQCANCHTPVGHRADFGDQCADCHPSVTSWLPASFNHENYTNCLTCHVQDKPTSHLSSTNCGACHSTTSWRDLLFEHKSSADCKSCHTASANHIEKGYNEQCSVCHSTYIWEKPLFHLVLSNCTNCHSSPTKHYPAVCTSCHDTDSWLNISVNHSGLTKCTDCHNVPTAHYPGACLSCHNTNSWQQINVDHSTLTACTSCHRAPVPHYPAACTSCHNTTAWLQISVNHTGLTNCTDCHSAPPNHYIGTCLTCHTTSSWYTLIYHDGTSDCSTCHSAPAGHYPGDCTLCHHSTTSWSADFNHSVTTLSCSTCHTAPSGHWTGECSNCHNTSSWNQVDFDHTGLTDCKSCHTSPKGHPNAQCSNCHTTDTWEVQD